MRKLSVTLAISLMAAQAQGLSSMPTMIASSHQPTSMPRTPAFYQSRKRISKRQMPVLHRKKQSNSSSNDSFPSSVAPFVAASATIALPIMATAAAQALLHGSSHNPAVEAEVLTDLAHVTLDVATLFGPSKLGIRLSSIIGRLFVIAADYVPDHTIVAEEMIFQSIMLGLAAFGFCRSALPMLLAAGSNGTTSLKRGKVYLNLLQPTGMSWNQFKAMDVMCMDWITMQAGETLADDAENGKYVYWLYSGNVLVSEQNRVLHNMTATSGKTAAEALVNEAQLMSQHKRKTTLFNSDAIDAEPPVAAAPAIQAGADGATLLRINLPKLRVLMKADKELEDCMKTLAFQSLQSKLLTAQSMA
ncbi:hypothetical protein MPSEU_000418500 [Mayamaea pseudoterrestris]|nr:hypothetical protein MPSEU_000418500 [Mayamaea pseudoterrestris]